MFWAVKAAAVTAFRRRGMRRRMLSVSMEDGFGIGIAWTMLFMMTTKAGNVTIAHGDVDDL